MAKFGSKSRLYQQQQQKLPTMPLPPPAPTTIYRPQIHHQQQQQQQSIHHSPTTRASIAGSNLITNPSLLKTNRGPHQLITTSTSVAQLQNPSYPTTKTFDQLNYLHEHHQKQASSSQHQTANFDRSKSTAIINSMTTKQQQHQQQHQQQRRQLSTTMNHLHRGGDDLGKFPGSPPPQLDASMFPGAKQPFSEL